MRRSKKQLRAISYAYTEKRRKEAAKLLKECKENGFFVEESRYPSITIKRCFKALELNKKNGGNYAKNFN